MIELLATLLLLSGMFTWVLCKLLDVLRTTSGRISERERKDYLDLVSQLLEKRETPPQAQYDMAIVHAQERAHKTQTDAHVEKAQTAGSQPTPKPASFNIDRDDVVHQ